MNSVSWFLYLADVVSNVSVVALLVALFFVAFCVLVLVGQLFSEGEFSKDMPNIWKYWWRCLSGAIFFGIVACLFPSKNTIYAIAASQVGEQIVKNEQVKGIADDASKALQQWIRRQIEPEEKKSKKD